MLYRLYCLQYATSLAFTIAIAMVTTWLISLLGHNNISVRISAEKGAQGGRSYYALFKYISLSICVLSRWESWWPGTFLPLCNSLFTGLTETHSCGLAASLETSGHVRTHHTPPATAAAAAQCKAQLRAVILAQTPSLLGWPGFGFLEIVFCLKRLSLAVYTWRQMALTRKPKFVLYLSSVLSLSIQHFIPVLFCDALDELVRNKVLKQYKYKYKQFKNKCCSAAGSWNRWVCRLLVC